MSKKKELDRLINELEKKAKNLPLAKKASDIVPPEGNHDAKLMFIGKAAGFHEHVQRRPFVGVAGKLLTESLSKIGVKRSEVWISNILKVRPPQNRDPVPEEIEAYKPYLDQEIRIIDPKIIVTLGRFSLRKFIPDAYISQIHGQARWVDWEGKKIVVFPMYHPAAALRNGQVMRMFEEDFAKLGQVMSNVNNQSITAEPEEEHKEATQESNKTQQLTLIENRQD